MTCPHIPELGYGEFGERLLAKTSGKRVPISGTVELTHRCNVRCKHCYLDTVHDIAPKNSELTTQQWFTILDQVADEGTLWLLLTGGEPLIRSDFWDIYLHAKSKGFLLTVFTNGTLLTPKLADMFAEYPPLKIEITLYGRTQETYEHITQVPGSYAKCIRSIELLAERGLTFSLKTMLLTLNKHELWDIKAYADDFGVQFRFDPLVNAGFGSNHSPVALRLAPEEAVAYEFADLQRVDDLVQFHNRFLGKSIDTHTIYTCGAGLRAFHIDPFGKLSLCLMARNPAFDLCDGSFHQGWYEFLRQARMQERSRETRCVSCKLLPVCPQCPGWSQFEWGDSESPVDYLCQTTHLHALQLGSMV